MIFKGRGIRQGNGPALSGALDDDARLFQVLEVKVNRGGRFQSHRVADLPYRGRVALGLDAGDDVVVDSLLHVG